MAAQTATGPTRTVLHVGCGPPNPQKLHPTFRGEGWKEVRLDIDPDARPDIVSDIVDMAPVPTASVDAVWSSHNVEHLYAHQVPTALGEFLRVLTPGGFALITLPDLQAVCRHIADDKLEDVLYQSPAGPIRPIDVVYGHRASIGRGNHFMAHRTGFTARTLGAKMVRAGFRPVRVRRKGFDLWALGHKPAGNAETAPTGNGG